MLKTHKKRKWDVYNFVLKNKLWFIFISFSISKFKYFVERICYIFRALSFFFKNILIKYNFNFSNKIQINDC